MKRLWTVYICLMLGIVGLLVLLRVDGISALSAFLAGCVTLGISTLLFQRAVRAQSSESKFRKAFEWCAGLSFLALMLVHFIIESPIR